MARIAGIDLPNEKRVEIGLTYIYGIGRHTANEILKETKINPDTRVKDLTEDEVGKIRAYIEKNCVVEGDLQREVSLNIKRLQEIGCKNEVFSKPSGFATSSLKQWSNCIPNIFSSILPSKINPGQLY